MKFKEWLKLQEVGTSSSGTGTNSIAMFKRPILGQPYRRSNLGVWGEEDPFFRKRKIKEHGGDPTAYGSTLGSDPDGQSLPQAYLKAQSAGVLDGGQPTLMMPLPNVKNMKKKSKK